MESLTRLHMLRAGYLFMGVGLALVKWPKLLEAQVLPPYEGVTLCLLTAMSLLAFLGLLQPARLLPLLLFETALEGPVDRTCRDSTSHVRRPGREDCRSVKQMLAARRRHRCCAMAVCVAYVRTGVFGRPVAIAACRHPHSR
jgi:hypothetical protein